MLYACETWVRAKKEKQEIGYNTKIHTGIAKWGNLEAEQDKEHIVEYW